MTQACRLAWMFITSMSFLTINYKYALWSILEVSGLLPEGLAESAMKMAFFARPASSRALQRKML